MNKAGATNRTTTTEKSAQQFDMDVFAAKSKFFSATLEMGWQLALIVLIPLIAGIKLDQHFASSPSYTLAGFMLAIAGGAAVVWRTVKGVAAEQAELQAKLSKTNAKKKGKNV
jgi:F0F1-type ATP synthase assembly protein I